MSSLRICSVCLILGFAQISVGQDSNYETGVDFSSLLNREEVLKELEVTEDQQEELKKQGLDARTRLVERLEELNLDWNSRRTKKEWLEQKKEIYENFRSEVAGIHKKTLLPHQMQRAREVYLWGMVNSTRGYGNFILSDFIRNQLEVTPPEAKKIKQEIDQLQADFFDDFDKLRNEYRQKANRLLNKEQRARLKKLLGDPSSYNKYMLRF